MIKNEKDIRFLLNEIDDENVLKLEGYFYSLGKQKEKLLVYKDNGKWVCESESEYDWDKWSNYSFDKIVSMLYNVKEKINEYCAKKKISDLDGLLQPKNVLESKHSIGGV